MLDKVMAWRGVFAIGVLTLVTVWLGWQGMLGFYIHPRYNLFTLVMAVIGVSLMAIAFFVPTKGHSHAGHKHAKGHSIMEWLSLGLVAAVVAIALVLPPTTLSSYTAENRSFGTVATSPAADAIDVESTTSGFENLTVRDWASLLIQTQDPSFFRGKPFSALGTITDSGDPDVFFLTRFVVTCCAVDAQPVSIPVYYPGWSQDFTVDSWVTVNGGFQVLPQIAEPGNLAVVPGDIVEEEVPREPYLF
ncbi:MAG TPA: TIGR03943 family protein [Pontimonas sp.]|nr:TIGR03943 family protein [Pontimonas sp.]